MHQLYSHSCYREKSIFPSLIQGKIEFNTFLFDKPYKDILSYQQVFFKGSTETIKPNCFENTTSIFSQIHNYDMRQGSWLVILVFYFISFFSCFFKNTKYLLSKGYHSPVLLTLIREAPPKIYICSFGHCLNNHWTPPPLSNGHSVAPIFGQNHANARLY